MLGSRAPSRLRTWGGRICAGVETKRMHHTPTHKSKDIISHLYSSYLALPKPQIIVFLRPCFYPCELPPDDAAERDARPARSLVARVA